MNNQLKYIALYLPQFHTFKENDEWWGRGFTEWTNVKPATPRFPGHYQPHVPHDDIGYYDLSDVNVMIRQAQMAKKYGIYGFSYYYYWFNGRKLMEKPLENMLHNKDVDIPFCLFWANHNWTRAWDAGNKEILLEQTYDETTNNRFIDDLIPYFNDPRYIKIDGRPLFLVYQANLIPNPRETVKQWRDYAKDKYNIDLYLVTIQQNNLDSPEKYGYDAALETTPNFTATKSLMKPRDIPKLYNPDDKITFYSYFTNVMQYVLRPREKYKLFRCVYPMWDNCPRRKGNGSWLFYGDSPKLFKKFLAEMSAKTIREFKPGEQFVFINAWNEWAEGTHLEPDKKNGYTYLEICRQMARKHSLYALKKCGFSTKTKIQAYMKLNGGVWAVICPVTKIRDGKKRTIKLFGVPVLKYTKR